MRLLWIILSAALAAACTGAGDEASSGKQQLDSNTDSDGDETAIGHPTDSSPDNAGDSKEDPQPQSDDTTTGRDDSPSAPNERGNEEVSMPNESDGDAESEQNGPDHGPSESSAPNSPDGGIDAGDGLPPGEAARIRCEAMDEETCRAQKPNGCIPIEGARYVEQDACIEPRFVGCTCMQSVSMECSSSCSDDFAIRYMRDAQDELWMFPTTCTPDGWQRIAADDPIVSVFDDAAKCEGD